MAKTKRTISEEEHLNRSLSHKAYWASERSNALREILSKTHKGNRHSARTYSYC